MPRSLECKMLSITAQGPAANVLTSSRSLAPRALATSSVSQSHCRCRTAFCFHSDRQPARFKALSCGAAAAPFSVL